MFFFFFPSSLLLICALLDCCQGERFSYWLNLYLNDSALSSTRNSVALRSYGWKKRLCLCVYVWKGQLFSQPRLFTHFDLGNPEGSFFPSSSLLLSRSRMRCCEVFTAKVSDHWSQLPYVSCTSAEESGAASEDAQGLR